MFDADVLIAGGGPAGTAAAIFARRQGLSVIVCEPRETPVDKACGEGIMPGGLRVLEMLGADPVGVPFRGIAYTDGKRRVEAPFAAGPGRGVRRTELHSCLSRLDSAPRLSRRITAVQQDAQGVTAGGLRARWLIAADGLHSPIRRALGIAARSGAPKRYGVRWHFRAEPWSEFVEVWWSRFGEAYVTPVAPDLIGIAILSSSKPDLNWFPELLSRLDSGPIAPPRGAGPLRQVVARRVQERVLLVGDAGGYEDALTGEGITLAVRQASAAIEAIANGDPARYERDWRRVTREYRYLTRGLVLSTQPAPGRLAIVPLANTFPSIFRHIVNRLAA